MQQRNARLKNRSALCLSALVFIAGFGGVSCTTTPARTPARTTNLGDDASSPFIRAIPETSSNIFKVYTPLGGGTGWALTDHTVVTAAHVVAGAEGGRVFLTNGDSLVHVDRLWIDPTHDIAFLYVLEPVIPVKVRPDLMDLGDEVWLHGFPNLANPAISRGVIFTWSSEELMLDATAQPGMSGGVVMDSENRAVGMIVACTIPPFGRSITLAIPLITILERMSYALEYPDRSREGLSVGRTGGDRVTLPRLWNTTVQGRVQE